MRPAILDRAGCVPCVEIRRVAERVEQHLVVGPADLCSQWLHYLLVGPQGRELAHVEEVAAREAAAEIVVGAEVLGEQADDVVAPGMTLLLRKDRAPDRPVEQDELGVDSAGGALSCSYGMLDDRLTQRDVVSGRSDLLAMGRRRRKAARVVCWSHVDPTVRLIVILRLSSWGRGVGVGELMRSSFGRSGRAAE